MTVPPEYAYVIILEPLLLTIRFGKSILPFRLRTFVLLVRPDFLLERVLAKLQQCRTTLSGQDCLCFSNVPGGEAVFTTIGFIVEVKEKDETIISPFVNHDGLMGQGRRKSQGCCFPFRPVNGCAFTTEEAETTPHDIFSAYVNRSTNDRTFVFMSPQGFFICPLPVEKDTYEFHQRRLAVVHIEIFYL